jgi:hypothetical protein
MEMNIVLARLGSIVTYIAIQQRIQDMGPQVDPYIAWAIEGLCRNAVMANFRRAIHCTNVMCGVIPQQTKEFDFATSSGGR